MPKMRCRNDPHGGSFSSHATHHALYHSVILSFTTHAEPICWTEPTTSKAEVQLKALDFDFLTPKPHSTIQNN